MTMTNAGGSPLECTVTDVPASQPAMNAVFESSLLNEDFNDGIPADWMVTDNAGEGLVWALNTAYGVANWTNGDGTAVMVDSDGNADVPYDTELRSPTLTADSDQLRLTFSANYRDLSTGSGDAFEVGISTDGGASWTSILSWNEDHGGFLAPPGEDVDLDLAPYVSDGEEFMLRWHYYTDDPEPWDWYVQLDDVQVSSSYEWLTYGECYTMEPGESVEMPMYFDATGLAPGTYAVNMVIQTNDPVNPEVLVPVEFTVVSEVTVTVDTDNLEILGDTENGQVHPGHGLLVPIEVTSLNDLSIESYQFTLFFDEDLLEPVGVQTEGTLSDGDVSLSVNTSVPGQISVAAADNEQSTTATPILSVIEGEEGTLIYVELQTKEGLGETSLSFDGTFQFNEGVPPVATVDGSIEIVPLYGDANLSASVTALDAALTLSHVVGNMTLGEAGMEAADVTNNDAVSALDAAYILDYVVGNRACFPADTDCGTEPAAREAVAAKGSNGQGSAAASHPALAASSEMVWTAPRPNVESGLTEVPLTLQSADGAVQALTITVPVGEESRFSVEGVESRLPDGWQMVHSIQDDVLRIAMAGSTPMPSGELVVLALRTDGGSELLINGTAAVNESEARVIAGGELSALPTEFSIKGNYPNPFNAATKIQLDLPTEAEVSLEIFNMLGQKVVNLPAQQMRPGTNLELEVDASGLASGSYVYRVTVETESGTLSETGRMTLVK
jgi:hypothetical protein